jgi:hypothetical protein
MNSALLARFGWVIPVLLIAALLAPTLWNGFPFVWADTGGYLARPFDRTLELGRSALYGAFIAAGIPLQFWPAAIIQAAVVLWVLWLLFRTHGLTRLRVLVAVVASLVLLTSLPWYVGQLMPDIWMPVAVLSLHLLAFRSEALRRAETIGLVAVLAFGIASHMATLALYVAVLIALVLLGLCRFMPFPRLRWPAAALAAGIVLALASNFVIAGRLAFTPGGVHFAFGRLVQDGFVARYLDSRCPDPEIRLCEYRADLPDSADGWLWGWDSPFYKLGGASGYEREAWRIVLGSVAQHPGEHLTAAVKATLQQFVMLETGEGLHARDSEHAIRALERYAPSLMPPFRAARQQHNAFDFTWMNWIHVPVALLSICALIIVALRFRRAPETAALAATVLLALLINAAISGVLSNPNPRYQSRIAWLAPLAVALALLASKRPRLDLSPGPVHSPGPESGHA